MSHYDDETSEAEYADDPELPDASDMDDLDDEDVAEGDSETVPCPHCRRPVYESAERCNHCGRYLSEEDAPRRHPKWLVLGVVLCLVIVLLAWVLR